MLQSAKSELSDLQDEQQQEMEGLLEVTPTEYILLYEKFFFSIYKNTHTIFSECSSIDS